jgi:hypothetical protein
MTQQTRSRLRQKSGNVPGQADDFSQPLKHSANEAANKMKERASSAVAKQKSLVAQKLESAGGALRQTAQNLDDPTVSRIARQAAERVDQFSEYARTHELGDLVNGIEDWARRNPGLFLGGTFIARLLPARFIKCSAVLQCVRPPAHLWPIPASWRLWRRHASGLHWRFRTRWNRPSPISSAR